MLCVTALLCLCQHSAWAQQIPTGLAPIPDKVFVIAEREDLTGSSLFALVNFDTAVYRVTGMYWLTQNPTLYFEANDLPLEVQPNDVTQVRVVFNPNGDTTHQTNTLLVIAENLVTHNVDTVQVPVDATIGPPPPIDTIRLRASRSAGLEPNTVRFTLVLESNLAINVGFAEALFRYHTHELYLGEYTVLTDSSDDEFRYTGLRIVPDNNREAGDTIADFHFTILHGTNGGGDTNSLLDLIRVEWFAKFTGNRIYTHTILDDTIIVSDVEDDPDVAPYQPTLRLYPNPTSSSVSIDVKGLEGFDVVEVMSSDGRVLVATTGSVIDLSALSSGAYFVRARSRNGSVTAPLIVR